MAKITKGKVYEWITALLISSLMVIIGNLIGYSDDWKSTTIGMGWLFLFTFLGLVTKELIPWDIPAVAYISLYGILFASPISPIRENVISSVESINLLALCTPVLAYAGVTVGRDWPAFKKIGWRGIIVSLVVIISTVLFCVIIGEVLFRVLG